MAVAKLIQKIKDVFIRIGIKLPTLENDNATINDIDPFTIAVRLRSNKKVQNLS